MYKNCIRLFLFVFIFSSCIFRPNYSRPYVDIPDSWRVDSEEACCIANVRWWENLNDPVLDGLIVEALENNNDLKVAIANVENYYAQFRVVYSELFPQITGNGIDIRQKQSQEANPFIPPNLIVTNYYSILLNFSYELDIWGKLHAASDAALAVYLSEVQARRTVVLTLVSSVAQAYLVLRQYDEQLRVSRATLKSFEESLVLAIDRFEGGTTSELPVEQARSEKDAAGIQVKQLEILVAQQENLISVLLGRNPGEVERGKLLHELTQTPQVPAGLPSNILEQRPDVMQAELTLVSAHSNVGVAKANLFPQISLTGLYGNQSLELKRLLKGSPLVWQFGGSIAAPIFNGGSYIAQLDQARAQEKQALYSYYQSILNAFKEVNDALVAHEKSIELLDIQKDQVKALSKYLELAQLEYDNGQVDYLNVLDAQRNLFSSELDMIKAEANTYLTLVDIYKALGGGWVIEADTIGLEGEDNICR